MSKLVIYKVDAFADKLFTGNPAAVCVLDEWLSEELMQNIAAENNLSETAFVVAQEMGYQIRWFTPTVEVDLCGHATLASAHVLFDYGYTPEGTKLIEFHSPRSGRLKVFKAEGKLFLDFPADVLEKVEVPKEIEAGIGIMPIEVYKGKTDYVAILESEQLIRAIQPVFSEIAKLSARGLIVTAAGDKTDFVSRFFAPQAGVPEDPVTGSAHTSLTPLWSKKLGKKEMTAAQLSKRGGFLKCIEKGERVHIGGQAKLFLKGEIYLNDK